MQISDFFSFYDIDVTFSKVHNKLDIAKSNWIFSKIIMWLVLKEVKGVR